MMRTFYHTFGLKLRWFLRRGSKINMLSVLIGCCFVCASFLPWINDPLGDVYSAWHLPVHIGWLYPLGFLNYGWLCVCCALYTFFFAWTGRGLFQDRAHLDHSCSSHLLTIAPVVLFLFQYLCVDIVMIIQLARHEQQMLLIQQHFGYQGSTQLIPLSLLTLNVSTFVGKVQLLLDCISYGPLFLLCVTSWLIWSYRHPKVWSVVLLRTRQKTVFSIFCIICLVLFIRAPLGMLCEYMAKEVIATGNYSLGLNLLHSARFLSPDFEQVAYYHIEHGKAQYYLSPTQLTSDSRVYLASAYRVQVDYLYSYQKLLIVWQEYPNASWVVDEMSTTVEGLAEASRPLRNIGVNRIAADNATLPWLHILSKVAPSNHYALYMMGRIQYDLHNYQACEEDMGPLLQISNKDAIQSSVYTYIALSEDGLHNYGNARNLLFRAIMLDPSYRNIIAREELSGLH